MLSGFLKMFVLKLLQEGQKSGYELMEEISERVGKRPSSGSLYPLLRKMHSEGLVKYRTKGRKKYYHLTKKGENLTQSLAQEKEQLFKTHRNLHQALVSTDLPSPPDIERKEFIRNSDILHEFMRTVKKLMNKKNFGQKEQKMRSIIQEANKKLKKL